MTSGALEPPIPEAVVIGQHLLSSRQLVHALGAAGYRTRVDGFEGPPARPSLLALDLDVAVDVPAPELVARARARFGGGPILAVAGLGSSARLVAALSCAGVCHAIPKRIEPTARGGFGAPDAHAVYTAARRQLTGARGLEQYLAAGAVIHERAITSSLERPSAQAELVEFLRRLGVRADRLSRAELASDELLTNALYDAPRGEGGRARFASTARTIPVALAPAERVLLRFGADGGSLALSVTDRFGALEKWVVVSRLAEAVAHTIAPAPGGPGAGLGLVMVHAAVNQLAIAVEPGRYTEVTVVIGLSADNREAQARGSSVHFHGGEQHAHG